jgi:hypothetical protein
MGKKQLMHMRPHGGPTHGYMKCYICEESHINLQMFENKLQKFAKIVHT